MRAAAIHQAIYNQLNDVSVTASLSTAYDLLPAIYSDVPQALDAGNDAFFPFIVIGGNTIGPFETKDDVGGNVLAQVDLYYRGTSKIAAAAIVDAIDARLRRQALTIAGVTHITTEFESATPTPDPDGRTLHCVLLYRVLWLT